MPADGHRLSLVCIALEFTSPGPLELLPATRLYLSRTFLVLLLRPRQTAGLVFFYYYYYYHILFFFTPSLLSFLAQYPFPPPICVLKRCGADRPGRALFCKRGMVSTGKCYHPCHGREWARGRVGDREWHPPPKLRPVPSRLSVIREPPHLPALHAASAPAPDQDRHRRHRANCYAHELPTCVS